MAISPLHSLGEGDMAHITQQLPRKQGQVGYMYLYTEPPVVPMMASSSVRLRVLVKMKSGYHKVSRLFK